MGKINLGRVIGGGLLAGLVLNVFDFVLHGVVLKTDWDTALQALNRPAMAGSTVALFVVLDFVIGIFLAWLYAAIRPRFGPGPMTAACAGLATWFLFALVAVSEWPMHLWPRRLVLIAMVAGLIYTPLAAMAAGWMYKEEGTAG